MSRRQLAYQGPVLRARPETIREAIEGLDRAIRRDRLSPDGLQDDQARRALLVSMLGLDGLQPVEGG